MVSNLAFTRGDHPMLEIQFVQGGKVVNPGPDFVWFCLRIQGEFDGDYLVLCEDFERISDGYDGEAMKYLWTGHPSFNTVQLNKHLGYNTGDTKDDKTKVTVTGEIGFDKDGKETSSLPFSAIVYHDLYHGDTSAPDEAVSGAATAAMLRAEAAAQAAEAAAQGFSSSITGAVALPVGQNTVAVEFPVPFPEGADVEVTSLVLQRPAGGNVVLIPWLEGEITRTGFTVKLTGEPDRAGYRIRYAAKQTNPTP